MNTDHDNAGKILLLARHAKSAWGDTAVHDYDRPLSARGLEDAPRMAAWIRSRNFVPDLLLCSPARRTRETATIYADTLGLPANTVIQEPVIYEASRTDLLKVLQRYIEQSQCCMLVGHNPGLDAVLEYLCPAALPLTDSGKLLTTAAVAALQLRALPANASAMLERSTACLLVLQRPREL
ncbi:MAG: histidine phosphatase family protein [Gammaproteobacteria bacterium]